MENNTGVLKTLTYLMNINQYFITDNLAFISTALLTYPSLISIKRVVFHPYKQGVKNFYLAPYQKANEIYLEYVSDSLKISPAQLTSKIATLKGIRAEMPEEKG